MIFPQLRVPASGPKNAPLAVIGMAPQKWELADKVPFTGPSGRIFNDALSANKTSRASVFVTNLCDFYIDDNNLYSVPAEMLDAQRQRVYRELEEVKPNVLFIMGGDTLELLTGISGIQKWRGSIITLECPSGRKQKCVVAMHPASFIRGQWKWLPLFKYVDLARAVSQSGFPELKLRERNAIVSPSFAQACDYLRFLKTQEWVSIDYEGLQNLSCLGAGASETEAMCIPLTRVGSPRYFPAPEEAEIWRLWTELLEDPNVKLIAMNASFEWIQSWRHGIYPSRLGFDPFTAHHCLYVDFGGIHDEWTARKRDPDNPGHGLALQISQYTDIPFYKDDGRHWRPELGERLFWEYNCKDVFGTFEIAMKQITELQRASLEETYHRSYILPFERCLATEWLGLGFDSALRADFYQENRTKILEIEQQLSDKLHRRVISKAEKKGKSDLATLNLASPKQMKHFLYQELGYKPRYHPKTKKITVDKDTVQILAAQHSDPVLLLLSSLKRLQDYENKVLNVKVDENSRIHTHYKLGGTNGTRWSSAETLFFGGVNLQNIPRTGAARRLFLPMATV